MPRLVGILDRKHVPMNWDLGTVTHFRSAIAEPEYQYLDPTEGDRACFVLGGSNSSIWTRETKHGAMSMLDPDAFAIFPLDDPRKF